eukprot:CAMPEP_0171830112 /NCGR_PEP_ID=MMETSP0992-20121227/8058_1 /TAXON_ID=483369 /ORGANISM="non described non described, Strain CCMP2098" /LENGTH=294 /DNA_ID=CAMNT_0012445411 /DNA_START=162 /DNA_END=1046 /DNA_ORIENTATION=-
MSESVVSEATAKLLTGSSNPDFGKIKSWDPQEVSRGSIFYAGQRVFLCPSIKVGSPDALTPEEGIGIPVTRASRTEAYLQKKKNKQMMEARSKMTKVEIEEETRKSEQALASFVKVNSAAKKTWLPDIQHHAFKKKVDLSGIVDKLALEDPADWEQVNQAGCAFWRKTVSGEIRVERPRMMGEKNSAVRTSATGGWQNEPEPYPLGTGLVFYDKEDFHETRSWLVKNRGMSLPDLIPKDHKKKSSSKPPPTAEELLAFAQRHAANVIQKDTRIFLARYTKYLRQTRVTDATEEV